MTIQRAGGAREGTVLDQGIVPNTGADLTSAINTLIAASSGRELRFPKGTYRVDSTINVTVDDVHLRFDPGAVLDASNATTGGTVLLVSGQRTATTSGVTPSGSSLFVGVRGASVNSPTGFQVGDYTLLTSTEVFNAERPTQYLKGEIVQITGITGGTQFAFANGLLDSYDTTTNTVTMTRMVMINRFTMTGGRIVGKGAGGQQTAIRSFAVLNARITGVTVDSTERQGIVHEASCGGLIADCFAIKVNETGLGYGFKANIGSCGIRIVGNHADRCRHGIDVDTSSVYPPCRDVTITGNNVVNCISAGISTHGGAANVTITGNTTDSCGGGIVVRSPSTAVVGNVIIGGKALAENSDSYRHGIWIADNANGVGSAGTDLVVSGNIVRIFADWGLENVSGILVSAPLVRGQIVDNVLSGFSQHGISLTAHQNTDARIAGNIIDCSTQVGTAGTTASHGIAVQHASAATGDRTSGLIVEGNLITSPLFSGIVVNGSFDTTTRSTAIRISGNTVKNYGKNGIQLSTGNYTRSVLVSGNVFPDTTGVGSTPPVSTDAVYYVSAQFLADPVVINNVVG